MFGFVDNYSTALNILNQQLEDVDYFEFLEDFREPVLQPDPGCKVGVPSLR
jgi:hypothetical protein